MRLSPTLSTYVARQFVLWFGLMMGGLVAIVLLFDMLEQLRRAATREQATTSVVVALALLRLPTLAQLLVTFAVLFGALFAFWRLTRSQELVVTRAAGVSVWQFLVPVLAATLCIGILKVTVFGPFAAVLLGRSERLETSYFDRPSTSGLFPSGLWLRQADGTGHTVIHAQRVFPERSRLENVIVFRFAAGDRFIGRIDAATATLASGRWELRNARVTTPEAPVAQQTVGTVATDLTWRQIEESFAPPETLSFWALPGFIAMLESAGFPALQHRLHYQAMLASPLLLCAMVLIAASFSLRPAGRRGTGRLVASGLATGFAFYVASNLVFALGLSGRIPVELAAWTPSIVCLLIGGSALLHLEEG